MKRLVIIGGGFAGVRLARKLKNQTNLAVTLINNSPDFRYCPALYRAATGYKMGIARLSLEWMFLDVQNLNLIVDTAKKIDTKSKKITLESGDKLEYDYAVCALGSVSTFFNIEGLHDYAIGMKTVEEIVELRKHLHKAVLDQKEEANYVVVGAGPTGVELAAALGGYLKRIVNKHGLENKKIKVWLVEAADRVLPKNSERASKKAEKELLKNYVNILKSTMVEKETLSKLETSAGPIKTNTVIWTAGTMINPFYKEQGKEFKFTNRHLIKVNKHLEASHNVYVIGDNASTTHSGLAQTAIRHADYVARDIKDKLNGYDRDEHKDKKPIQVIPAGEKWAVLEYGNFVMVGRFAAFIRKMADFIGYADVLGYFRGSTIWSQTDIEEDSCDTCRSGR
ncbi:FAD-dependent oxidoreductase [Candidatus Saccharibacteria bacterium]|nr:FAD-dependent oxidoreductase [Candidatus Saccharibacteria bacterium]